MKKLYLMIMMLFAGITLRAADPDLLLLGSGTEDDPYLIGNYADMMTLAQACGGATAAESGHYAGMYFRLTADINMANATDFYGIGTAPVTATSANSYYFGGIFDGAGHRISNLNIKGVKFDATGKALTAVTAGNSRMYVGVFGRLGAGAVVKNLIVDSSCHIEGINMIGGIAGAMAAGSTIQNCANYGEVISYNTNVGGIVGVIEGTVNGVAAKVEKCFNAGNVSVNSKTIGGIAGMSSYSIISGCANIGMVRAYNFNTLTNAYTQTIAGGIVGQGTGTAISDCFNTGYVYAEKQNAGGIAGYMTINSSKGNMYNCINTGAVESYYNHQSSAFLGSTASSGITMMNDFKNCYYDSQLLTTPFLAPCQPLYATSEEIKGLTTTDLTSGTALAGFTDWKFREGYYPVPAGLEYAELDVAASTYLLLPQGQSAFCLDGNATLKSIASGTTAMFEEPNALFSVNGTTVSADPSKGMGTNRLFIANGNFVRPLMLTTYKVNLPGEGTEASPYIIATKQDMKDFAELTIVPRARFANTYFRLKNDIDMQADTTFHGIALGNDPMSNTSSSFIWHFDGTFDGAGYTIRNLDIRNVKYDANGMALSFNKGTIYISGLFGSLGEGAVVKNVNIDSNSYMECYGITGGIAGSSAGACTIENCHVAANIKAMYRYVGGIYAYSAVAPYYPVEIKNCTFSGNIESNYDYVGGIISYNAHPDTKVTGCAYTGSIKSHHFNDAVKSSTALSRFGGIAAIDYGTIEGCSSYGTIVVEAADDCTKVDGVGGIAGQISNSGTAIGSLINNFTSSQISVTGALATVNVGAIVGYRYFAPTATAGPVTGQYCDLQLNICDTTVGSVSPVTLLNNTFHGLNTSDFTTGAPIDTLAQHFTFENGYYPMPKSLAANENVRAAAATFFTLPAGQTIRMISDDVSAPINTVMPIAATLEEGVVFYLEGGKLKTRSSSGSDVLTLTNGTFSTFYPLKKDITLSVTGIDNDADPIISTVYYTTDGRVVLNPMPGTTVIAVGKTATGRQTVTKMVVR